MHPVSILKAVAHLERISVRDFASHLIRDAAGKVPGPAAVVRDVTARWNREKALRQRLSALEAGVTIHAKQNPEEKLRGGRRTKVPHRL